MNINKKTYTPADIKLMSFLLALYLNISIIMITLFPSADGGIDSGGLLGSLYVFSAISLFMVSWLKGHIKLRNISSYSLFLITILIILYQYTNTHIGIPRTPFSHFFVFTIVSFLLPFFISVDVRLLLKFIMAMSLPAIFRINQIFIPNSSTSTESLSMGYSYSFLLPIVASFVYVCYYFKNEDYVEKIFTLMCVMANLLYFFYLAAYGSRGPVVAIILLLAVMFILKVNPIESNGIKIAKSHFIVFLIGAILLVIFFIPMLYFMQSFFDSFGIHLNFIDKILNRSAEGDVTSGRNAITATAINAILQRPLLGYGIDQFENNTGIVYPHNFILQLLYDGGLFLTLITIIPIIKGLVNVLRVGSSDKIIIVIALFFGSVPGSLLSNDIWTIATLWIFFGSVLSKQFVYEH